MHLSLQVKIRGFSEKQSILLNSIIRKLVGFVVDDKKFEVYKELVGLQLSLLIRLLEEYYFCSY